MQTWLACLAIRSLTGAIVSSNNFNTSNCLPATVPGTAFITLLNNNKFNFTDPFYDSNLYFAPDINTTGREHYTYYYRTEVESSADDQNKILWLRLRGINYRARVYVDGQLIKEDGGADVVEGMYHRWNYVVSSSISAPTKHIVAVLVEPPDFPGSCRVNCLHCGQGGSHGLAKSTTMQFSAGWDWIRGTPDRNTGMWDLVTFFRTAKVSLRHSFVKTSNIKLRPSLGSSTGIKVSIEPMTTLIVRSSNSSSNNKEIITGELKCSIVATNNPSVVVGLSSLKINIGSNSSNRDFEVTLPSIAIQSPKLWYPHTHGTPFLYRATFTYIPDSDNSSSSIKTVQFGIREIETYIDATTQGRGFKVNGVKIFLQGGNWIHTDQFLRYATNAKRYYNEVNMHVQMNMNIIRVWGGGLTERPEFYDAADELGIFIMQEFWQTGDNNGRWAGNYNWPLNHHVYLDNARDMILMVRNHPSLLFWCGGNELYPKSSSPPKDIATDLPSLISKYDPGRFYIPSSMSNYTNYDPNYALAPKDGPYGILLPTDFYEQNPGLTYWNGSRAKDLPLSFQPEVGSVSNPRFESLQRFLSESSLAQFPGYESSENLTDEIKMGSAWDFHNYIGFVTSNTTWRDKLEKPFKHLNVLLNGSPANVSEYALAAQIVQMQQYHCLFEGFQQFMFKYYTAVIMWKSQSPWPVFRGALYDSFLSQTGGYWGARRALTKGLHVQMNLLTWEPTVLNKGYKYMPTNNTTLAVTIHLYNLSGKIVTVEERSIPKTSIPSNDVIVLDKVNWPPESETLLVRLTLVDDSKELANNFYWSSDPSQPLQQYNDLASLHHNVGDWVDVSATITSAKGRKNKKIEYQVVLSVSKNEKYAAMFVQLDLVDMGKDQMDKRILPVWFSDNLICLLPGEVRTLSVTSTADIIIEETVLRITGWNVNKNSVQVIH